MNETKLTIRKQLKDLRNNYDADALQINSELLQRRIINSDEYKMAKSIFCYISFDKEIDTSLILNECLLKEKILSVPLIIGKSKMIACKINNLNGLAKNNFGILEPSEKNEMPKNNIDLAIIPALGYNNSGFRIGYGGGYYDNYLKDFIGMTFGMILKDFMIDFRPDKYDIAIKRLFIL